MGYGMKIACYAMMNLRTVDNVDAVTGDADFGVLNVTAATYTDALPRVVDGGTCRILSRMCVVSQCGV